MKRNLFGLLIITSALLSAAGQWANASQAPKPTIEIEGAEAKLRLPEKMQAAIHKVYPSFRPFRHNEFDKTLIKYYREKIKISAKQAPFAVIGDFNGDKNPDVAILGRTKTKYVTLVVLSSGKNYIIDVENSYPFTWITQGRKNKDLPPVSGFLTLVPKGPVIYMANNTEKTDIVENSLILKHEAFEFHAWEKASQVIYYDKAGKLQYLATSD